MYQLYIANKNYSSWSLRPWVLLKQLNIPFKEHQMIFDADANWESFRKFSPSGTVPCLIDDDITVWDSLSIIEYLAENHHSAWPKEQKARAWARSAAAEMHSGFMALRDICSMNCGIRVDLNAIPANLKKEISRIDEMWQEGLDKFSGPFLGGKEFTAVDAFFAPVVFRIQTYGLNISNDSEQYKDMMLNLNAMQEWYQSAIEEPWIDPAHEEYVSQYGKITQDFRSIRQ